MGNSSDCEAQKDRRARVPTPGDETIVPRAYWL